MKTSKVQITFILLLMSSIVIPFFYNILSDVLLGNAIDKIDVYVTKFFKPVSPVGVTVLILLLANIVIFSYNLWRQKSALENNNLILKDEEKYLRRRIEQITDSEILLKSEPKLDWPLNKSKKIAYIENQMVNFVDGKWYIKGIQLYDFSVKLNEIRISRVVEYIDNISSWDHIHFNIDSELFLEFNKAVKNKHEKEFVKKYVSHLNSLHLNEISLEHTYQYAFINVANQLMKDRGEVANINIHFLTEIKLFTYNKRIGILEAMIYLTLTEETGYIFKKKYGDVSKKGRYYLTILFFIDGKPHLMVFIFEKNVKDLSDNKKIDDILLKIAEDFLESLAYNKKIR